MTQPALKNQVTRLRISTGIDASDREAVSRRLMTALADSYKLMANTQILHWNVQGPLFFSVHKLTEAQYEDLFEAVDDIAERIRSLGMPGPKSVDSLMSSGKTGDIDGEATLESQIDGLIRFNESIATFMREAVSVAEKAGDVKTADLLTDRIGQHEENAWMLRATVAETV